MKSNGYFHSHSEPLWQYAHGIITSRQRDEVIHGLVRTLRSEEKLQIEMDLGLKEKKEEA
jgi:hypothetical protein